MTELALKLPRRAWQRVYRVTGAITAATIALSVIITNVFMELFSAGINLQGLAVSVFMPVVLGTPMTFFLMLKHVQLQQANQQLSHLASTDWLTACLNRGAFTAAVIRYLDRRQAGDRGALLIVDADDFKRVNDRFGHEQGDAALRLIAQAIRRSVRGSDIVGRLGGEEFGVFLADADIVVADFVAERIRRAVSSIDFQPGEAAHALSVSIGGATYRRQGKFGELYRTADQHLYAAKNSGRDRVALPQAA